MTKLLYLHGLLSSPSGSKAELLRNNLGAHSFKIPLIPNIAMDVIEQHVKGISGNVGLIGYSLGGFYATIASQRFDIPVVLLNPSVLPSSNPILRQEIIQHGSIGLPVEWVYKGLSDGNPSIFDQLIELEKVEINKPQNILALIQQGDELADCNKSRQYYKECEYIMIPNGNHKFDNLTDWIPEINIFFQQYYH